MSHVKVVIHEKDEDKSNDCVCDECGKPIKGPYRSIVAFDDPSFADGIKTISIPWVACSEVCAEKVAAFAERFLK